MAEPTARYDVTLGDVHESQVVIGDHTTVVTPHGVKVVRIVGDAGRPEPRLRPTPVLERPRSPHLLVGRAAELAACAGASRESPVQVHGVDGAGKTTLLKRVAHTLEIPRDGVVFLRARRRSLDDLEAMLFGAFWESATRFVPVPGELHRYLGDRRALLVLDDLDLDRDDLDALLEVAPGCTLIAGSPERSLWDRGEAIPLHGLDPDAGAELIAGAVGRQLSPAELEAARKVSRRLDGRPQALVEAATLVADGTRSLQELTDGSPAELTRTGDSSLTDSQRAILGVLAVLPSTSLGVEPIARLAGVPDAERDLADLERTGWVRSDSPRYRLTGSARPQHAGQLIRGLAEWARTQKRPEAVAQESEAIEAALELGAGERLTDEAVELSRAAESRIALGGLLGSWQRVLSSGIDAARAAGRDADEAYMLHQLGSRALCVGATEAAAEHLGAALRIRELIGDTKGAELTRANLEQLGGGGGQGDGGRDGPRGPRPSIVAAGAAIVVVAGVGLALLAGGDGKRSADTGGGTEPPITTTTTTTDPPSPTVEITIQSPQDRAYRSSDRQRADYTCRRDGDPAVPCEGPVPPGAFFNLTPGTREFTVTAEGAKKTVTYTVDDTEKPEIVFVVPSEGDPYEREQSYTVAFSCTDDDPDVSCEGSTPLGAELDTSKSGDHEFTVTTVDDAGNDGTRTIPYTVYVPHPK